MRRTQVQFDEATYEALKREAHNRGVSMSEVLRQLVREHLLARKPPRWRLEDFTFIGSGNSGQTPDSPLYPISEHHDEALVEVFDERFSSTPLRCSRWRTGATLTMTMRSPRSRAP